MGDGGHGHSMSEPLRMNVTCVFSQTEDVAQIITVTY